MIIECTHPDHHVDAASGVVSCPDPNCLVAAASTGFDPMSRLPGQRPDWILDCPDRLDAREVEALAVLGDAGLVPQIVELDGADHEDAAVPYLPAQVPGARRVG